MPVLKRPEEQRYVDLPARRALRAGETDVLVVGGSIAGMAAAASAARRGARVVLAERYGMLGGDATASLVSILMSYYSQHPRPPREGEIRLFPEDYGDGKPAVGGFYLELVERLVNAGGAIRPSVETGFTFTIDPEIFKITAINMMDDAGVELLFYADASGVVGKGNVDGVIFETKSGPLVISAKVVVDTTGDGDVAVAAGAPFELGNREGYPQPITLYFIMSDFNRTHFADYVSRHPDQWVDVYGLWDLIEQARKAGDLHLQRENILMFGCPRTDEVVIDSTRVTSVRGTNVWDLTHAQIENVRQMHEIAAFVRKYVPGFERAYISQSGPSLYVRESRRVRGGYQLTADDLLAGKTFDDVVARGAYCIDIHNPTGSGTMVKHLPPGVIYDIPLRCLIPENTGNVLIADRAISATHEAIASLRVMPIGAATGQAAGVCAAIAAQQGKQPREVDVREVQQALLEQKANLGERVPAGV